MLLLLRIADLCVHPIFGGSLPGQGLHQRVPQEDLPQVQDARRGHDASLFAYSLLKL